jgi:hypothetical protein
MNPVDIPLKCPAHPMIHCHYTLESLLVDGREIARIDNANSAGVELL